MQFVGQERITPIQSRANMRKAQSEDRHIKKKDVGQGCLLQNYQSSETIKVKETGRQNAILNIRLHSVQERKGQVQGKVLANGNTGMHTVG